MAWASAVGLAAAVAAANPFVGAAPDAASLRFVTDGTGSSYTARGPHYAVRAHGGGVDVAANAAGLRLRFQETAGAAAVVAERPQPGRVNVLTGRDPQRWRVDQQAFGRVRFRGVYPGIDVAYYGRDGWVEQDVIVAPGAGWRQVAFSLFDLTGPVVADRLAVGADGALTVAGSALFRLDRPVAYQETEEGRRAVEVAYRLEGGTVRFEVGSHDPARELVIDPVVSYATFLGGDGNDEATGVAVGVTGDVYVAGTTASLDFPAEGTAPQGSLGGGTDAFVARYSHNDLVYATYLGGAGNDAATGVAVRPSGEIDVVGSTTSLDFPVSPNAVQDSLANGTDAFVARLDATGGYLLHSTYLGAKGSDVATAVAQGYTPDAFVAGYTNSTSFPTTVLSAQTDLAGGRDAFMSRLRPTGGIPNIHAFLEVCPLDDPAMAQIRADFTIRRNGVEVTSFSCTSPVSAIPIAQWTDELIVLQGLRTLYHMDYGDAGQLPWTGMTFYNWLKSQVAGFNIVDGASGPSCCGTIDGGLYIKLPDADDANRNFDRTWRGIADNVALYGHEARHVDGFVHSSCCPAGGDNCDDAYDEANLSPHGIQRWLAAHWLSGDVYVGFGCADPATVAAAASWLQQGATIKDDAFCSGTLPPVPIPPQPGGPCPRPLDMTLAYSTYLGGKVDDRAQALRVEGASLAYVAGRTASSDFPVTSGAYQKVHGGGTDAFVAKIQATALRLPKLAYATFLGGTGFDEANAVAVGSNGEMFVAGRTASSDFPVSFAAFQGSLAGVGDGFITRLRSPSTPLPPLVFSTYVGGRGDEAITGLARDASGFAVAGWTTSTDLPVVNAFQPTSGGGTDGVAARFGTNGLASWVSYLGGAKNDRARAVAKKGKTSWVVGDTTSKDFPVTLAPPGFGGGSDAFVAKVQEP